MPPAPGEGPKLGVPEARGATADEMAKQIQIGADGRITMHMDDLDIRRALELLSREGGLNIMVSPGVTGRVTANLEQATVEQTLTAILKLGNLTARREDGLIYVYAPQDLKQQSTYAQRITTRIYRLNYIRAADLMSMVANLLSPDGTMTSTPASNEGINDSPTFSPGAVTGTGGGGGGGGGGGSGSDGGGNGPGRGTSGGNSLSGGDVVIVRDYENHLRTVDEIVAKLDIQPIQVLVEAVIVSVELTRERELGVNYSAVDNLGRSLGVVGNGAELAANSGFTPAKLLTVPVAGAGAAARAAAGRINGGIADGGLSSNTNGIKFGFVSDNNSAFIRALETMGETRVLASPRLLVLNKQKAEIQLGQRLGYSTVTQNFTSNIQSVQFLNTGTLLRLRPFISSDGMIRMEIHPERSSGSINASNLPNANTAEVTTNVMIPNGRTLVIGGLIENEDNFNYQGLPGLNRVPIVGAVFGFRERRKVKRELIVMLTPHIMDNCAPPSPGPEAIDSEELSSPGPSPSPRPLAPAPRDQPSRDDLPPEPREIAPVAEPSERVTVPVSLVKSARSPHAKRHVVAIGENYWTISRLHYKTGRYYLGLWFLNRKRSERPEHLKVGDNLTIPAPEELERSLEVDPRTNRLLDGTEVAAAVDRILDREANGDGQVIHAASGSTGPRPTASREPRGVKGPSDAAGSTSQGPPKGNRDSRQERWPSAPNPRPGDGTAPGGPAWPPSKAAPPRPSRGGSDTRSQSTRIPPGNSKPRGGGQ